MKKVVRLFILLVIGVYMAPIAFSQNVLVECHVQSLIDSPDCKFCNKQADFEIFTGLIIQRTDTFISGLDTTLTTTRTKIYYPYEIKARRNDVLIFDNKSTQNIVQFNFEWTPQFSDSSEFISWLRLCHFPDTFNTDSQRVNQFRVNGDSIILQITNDTPHYVLIPPYIDTDSQSLSLVSDTLLSITRGNTISLSSFFQIIDTLYWNPSVDSLYLKLKNDPVTHRVYIEPSSLASADKQRFDTLQLIGYTLWLSIQRDSVPAHQIDFSVFIQLIDTLMLVGDDLVISLLRDSVPALHLDLSVYRQGLSFTGGASPYTLDISGSPDDVTFSSGTNIILNRVANNLEISSSSGGPYSLSTSGSRVTTLIGSGTSVEFIPGTGMGITFGGTSGAATLTFTPVDQSATNELDTWDLGANGSYTTISNTEQVNFLAGGFLSVARSGNSITYTGIESDADSTNELQTWGNAGTTSYTGTLSAGGGGFSIVSGANITIAHSSGTITISAETGMTDLTFTGSASPYTLNSSTGSDVTFNRSGIITLSRSSNELTIGAIESDGDPLNELQYIDSLYMIGTDLFVSLFKDSMAAKMVSLAGLTYSFDLGANGSFTTISNGEQIDFVGTGGTTTSRSGNIITINSTPFSIMGTTNQMTKWISTTDIGDAQMFDNGSIITAPYLAIGNNTLDGSKLMVSDANRNLVGGGLIQFLTSGVDGGLVALDNNNASGYMAMTISNSSGGTWYNNVVQLSNYGPTYSGNFLATNTPGKTGDAGWHSMYSATGTGLIFENYFSVPMVFATGQNARMILSGTGNLNLEGNLYLGSGLGSTATQRLHVADNARISGAIYDSYNNPGIAGQVAYSGGTSWGWGNLPIPVLPWSTSKPAFGQRYIEINELADYLYNANVRYEVLINGVPDPSYNAMFDGVFDAPIINVASGSEISIDFTSGRDLVSAITYPQGYLYINYYYTSFSSGNTVICYFTGGGTVDISSSAVDVSNNAALRIWRYTIPQTNYLQKITIEPSSGGGITEIAYTMERAGEIEDPISTKFTTNNFFNTMSLRSHVGDYNASIGTNGQLFMTDGSTGAFWRSFGSIPGVYNFITNIADSLDDVFHWDLGANGSYTSINNTEQVNFLASGPIAVSRVGNEITYTVTEVDGDPTNEIPTLTHSGSGEILSSFSLGIGSINIKVGAGLSAVRSGSGADGILTISNTITDTDTDNYVDSVTFNPSSFVLTLGRTGALASLFDTIMDHDFYKVNTLLASDAITNNKYTKGYIGFNDSLPQVSVDIAGSLWLTDTGSVVNFRMFHDTIGFNRRFPMRYNVGYYETNKANSFYNKLGDFDFVRYDTLNRKGFEFSIQGTTTGTPLKIIQDTTYTTAFRGLNESRIDWNSYSTITPQFGQRRMEINELSDVLYLADRRFKIRTTDSITILGDDNGGILNDSVFFDNDYTSSYPFNGNDSTIFNIYLADTSGIFENGISEPAGYIYLSFYGTDYDDFNNRDTIYLNGIHGGSLINYTGSRVDISADPQYRVYRYTVPATPELKNILLTVVTKSNPIQISSINYLPLNPQNERPYLSKYVDNTLVTGLGLKSWLKDYHDSKGDSLSLLVSLTDSVLWKKMIGATIMGDTILFGGNPWKITASDGDTSIINDSVGIETVSILNGPGIITTLNGNVITVTAKDTINTNEIQSYAHSGTTSYTNTLTNLVGQPTSAFSLVAGPGINLSHNGSGTTTISNTGVIFWLLNGGDDAFPATQIDNNESAGWSGANGITAKLAASGAQTMIIDGQLLQWYLAATTGTPALIGNNPSTSETVLIQGTGFITTSISGNVLSITNNDPDQSVSNEIDVWLLNGADDAFGSTQIDNNETVSFDGTNGITAALSGSGSQTLNIDGSALQWILSATSGTSQTIGNSGSPETVLFQGTGGISTSISGNTITFNNSVVNTDNQSLFYSGAVSPINLNISGGTGVTLASGAGINFTGVSGTNITINSVTNLGWTSASNTVTSSTGVGAQILSFGTSFAVLAGLGDKDSQPGTTDQILTSTGSSTVDWKSLTAGNTGITISGLSISATDISATNEAQTFSVTNASPNFQLAVNAISGVGGGTATFVPAGTISFGVSGNTITITGAADGDGNIGNEYEQFTHTGSGTLISTLNHGAGSFQLSTGTGLSITRSGTSLDAIATFNLDLNGCANCVTFINPSNVDHIATDPVFFYQYEEGNAVLNVPFINLNGTNQGNVSTQLYIAPNGDERVFISSTESSTGSWSMNANVFYHRLGSGTSTFTIPSGINVPVTHYIMNEGSTFNLVRSGSNTINGGTSQAYSSTDHLIILSSDGAGNWRSTVGGSGGGGSMSSWNLGANADYTSITNGTNVNFITTGIATVSRSASTITIGVPADGDSDPINERQTWTNSGTTSYTGTLSQVSGGGGGSFQIVGGSGTTISHSGGIITISSSGGGGSITGSGTTDYITKWTGVSAIGTGSIRDNGKVAIGDAPNASYSLLVNYAGANDMKLGNSGGTSNRIFFGDGTFVSVGEEGSDDRLYLRGSSLSININGSLGAANSVFTSNGTTASWVSLLDNNASNETDNLTYSGTSTILLSISNSQGSGGSDVNIVQGAGITFTSQTSSSFTINAIDQSISNEAQTWTNSGTSTYTGTLGSAPGGGGGGGSFQIVGSGGTTVSHSGGIVTISSSSGGITGSGAADFLARWNTSSNLTSSLIRDNGSTVAIGGTLDAAYTFFVNNGNMKIGNAANSLNKIYFGDGTFVYVGESGADDRLYLRGTTLTIETQGSVGSNGQVLTSNGATASWISLADNSATNEAQTWSNSGTTNYTGSLNAISGIGGGSFTIQGSGGTTVSHSSGVITISSSAGGSQTLSTSGSNITTLSGGGGSVQFVAGSGMGVAFSGSSGAAILTFNNTDPDQSISNEGILTVEAGGITTSVIRSNSNSGSSSVTLSYNPGNGISITESGSTITFAATDVSASNETDNLQFSSNTLNISNSQGSGGSDVNFAAGNNISLSSTLTTLTIAQPAFTSLTTGMTTGRVLFVGADGTPDALAGLAYNSGSVQLTTGEYISTTFANPGVDLISGPSSEIKEVTLATVSSTTTLLANQRYIYGPNTGSPYTITLFNCSGKSPRIIYLMLISGGSSGQQTLRDPFGVDLFGLGGVGLVNTVTASVMCTCGSSNLYKVLSAE